MVIADFFKLFIGKGRKLISLVHHSCDIFIKRFIYDVKLVYLSTSIHEYVTNLQKEEEWREKEVKVTSGLATSGVRLELSARSQHSEFKPICTDSRSVHI